MKYLKGERVVHPGMPAWGIGEVLEEGGEDHVRIFFVGAGEKKLSLKHVTPLRVSGGEAAHPVLDNLRISSSASGIRYQSLPESIQIFLAQFPEGFRGERFARHERDYKDKAHRQASDLLGREPFDALLAVGDHAELVRRALKLINATNLVYPGEKISLRDGLKSEAAQSLFSLALHGLLHGDDSFESRFSRFAKVLDGIGAGKWTTATYFPFFLHPDQYMFVKPTITRFAAELCGFELNYTPQLNWRTYHSVLGFSRYLFDALAELEPRDMIDVQSFMWCIAPGTYADGE